MSTSKKRKGESSRDPAVWLQWYNEDSEDEDAIIDYVEDESDKDEQDLTFHSDHNTDSEEELSDNIQADSDEDEVMDDLQNYYIGKDGQSKWNKKQPPTNVRTRAHNIITHSQGPTGAASQSSSEIEALDLFIDNTFLAIIATSTNIYIEELREKFIRERDAKLTDIIEIRAFIGLLYLIGSFRCSRKNLHQLWDNSKGNGMESCYLTMSEQRFRFLLRCIRFDDIRDRNERKKLDKLAPIREAFEVIVNNFQRHYSPSEYVTIDEQLLAFRGRCSFRQYIPNKPSKYGIKTFALVDAKTAYTIKLETYVGTQPKGPYEQSNNSKNVVMRMVEPIQGTNRNVTGDNWFTSVPLVNELLADKKLTYVGTIRKNKREIPKEFLPNKNRTGNSSLFGFQKNLTLVSYCPKKNKSVLVISTMHHDNAIDPDTAEKRKPEMITFYNGTKIGVDLVDQLCQKNNVARNTRRWPMVVFYNLLNVAGINAFCIYKSNKANINKRLTRTEFLKNISWEMIKPQMRRRAQKPQIPRELRRRAMLLLGEETAVVAHQQPQGSRGRCYYCGRVRDKTTRKWCAKCMKWVCNAHLKEICLNCFSEEENVRTNYCNFF